MKKEEIKAQKTVGPYSQGIIFGNLIFVSGQIGIDPKSNNLGEDIEEQTKQVLENLKNVLKAAGSDINNVLKTTVYLADMEDFPLMNEIYASYFNKPYPARATVEVSNLPKGALIEIDCIAFIKIKENCCGQDCSCS